MENWYDGKIAVEWRALNRKRENDPIISSKYLHSFPVLMSISPNIAPLISF